MSPGNRAPGLCTLLYRPIPEVILRPNVFIVDNFSLDRLWLLPDRLRLVPRSNALRKRLLRVSVNLIC